MGYYTVCIPILLPPYLGLSRPLQISLIADSFEQLIQTLDIFSYNHYLFCFIFRDMLLIMLYIHLTLTTFDFRYK
jgi:hypothetical protein